MGKGYRVLIADDQTDVRSALRLLLHRRTPFRVVGEASDTEDLLAQVQTMHPDLVLLDWELPGLSAGQAATIPGVFDSARTVIVLSGNPEARNAAEAAGAAAFLSKGSPPETVLEVLSRISKVE